MRNIITFKNVKHLYKFSDEFLTDVRNIIAEAERRNIRLSDWDYDCDASKPFITHQTIQFNGADKPGDTFALFITSRAIKMNYCDTQLKPYDIVAKAVLIMARYKYNIITDLRWPHNPWYCRRAIAILKTLKILPEAVVNDRKYFLQKYAETFAGGGGARSYDIMRNDTAYGILIPET